MGQSHLAFTSHNSADEQTGALGDVEIILLNEENVISSYEMKMKKVKVDDINRAIQKIRNSRQDIKQQLTLIVARRNKIAHKADIAPTLNIGNRWYIDETMVGDTVDFLEQVVESIHQIL